MKPYSQDLRDRLIPALEAGEEPQSEIAERFGVSLSFVEKLWHRWRVTGSSEAKPHAGGPARCLREHAAVLGRAVAKQPNATLEELRERLRKAKGPEVAISTICRELQRLRLPLKKSRSTPLSGIRYGWSSCAPSFGKQSAR